MDPGSHTGSRDTSSSLWSPGCGEPCTGQKPAPLVACGHRKNGKWGWGGIQGERRLREEMFSACQVKSFLEMNKAFKGLSNRWDEERAPCHQPWDNEGTSPSIPAGWLWGKSRYTDDELSCLFLQSRHLFATWAWNHSINQAAADKAAATLATVLHCISKYILIGFRIFCRNYIFFPSYYRAA